MNWQDLLQKNYLLPAAKCGAAAALLFLLAWWRERKARIPLTVAAVALTWIACHFLTNFLSYLFPPKWPEDWLLPGAAGMLLVAVLAGGSGRLSFPVSPLAALILAGAVWLGLRQLPWLLERGETDSQRLMWTASGILTLLVTFASAEVTARRVPPFAFMGGLTLFALLCALSLWRMAARERDIVRLLCVAALCGGGLLAGLIRPRSSAIVPGVAGWISAGTVALFGFACLSRVANVPLLPMATAAGAVPAAALLMLIHTRFFISGRAPAFMAGMMLAGTAVFWLGARDQAMREEAPAATAPTGADDTGAYD